MSAIFKREFKAYFTNPIGYIILTIFYFFLGFYFKNYYSQGGNAEIAMIVLSMCLIAVFIIPLITMRLFSDDRRQKVDQALFTAPVTITSVVLGKFFAALLLFVCCTAPVVVFEIIALCLIKVNVLADFYALLGLWLLAASLIAIGMFISTLTESPSISAILTLAINLVLVLFIDYFVQQISVTWIATALSKLSFVTVAYNFGDKVFSIPDIVYFLSVTAAFIFLSVRSLERRRWA